MSDEIEDPGHILPQEDWDRVVAQAERIRNDNDS